MGRARKPQLDFIQRHIVNRALRRDLVRLKKLLESDEVPPLMKTAYDGQISQILEVASSLGLDLTEEY